jgi:phosphoribosylaminoimidazole-succinocarboxamide synthase
VGADYAARLREQSVKLYSAAAEYAFTKGIIIADTKFEFGRQNGEVILIDELLTPDSSRFWPAQQYQEGKNPPSLDKQFVRDHLESISWNKQPPAPELPDAIVENTRAKYLQAYKELTGETLS